MESAPHLSGYHRQLTLLALILTWLAGRAVIGAETQPAEALEPYEQLVARLPRLSVGGKVLDSTGKALEGADVWLYYSRGANGLRDRVTGKARSGADGSFAFQNAIVWEPQTEQNRRDHTPRYFVIARHPQHGAQFLAILQGDSIQNLTVQLVPTKPHKLTVTDADGKPIQGARAMLYWAMHPGEWRTREDRDRHYLQLYSDIDLCSGTSDEKGLVELAAPGEPAFRVFKDGFAPGYGDEKIILFPSARVAGQVTFADGKPAAGIAVWFNYRGERLIYDDVTLTDAQGRYEFRDVPGSGFRFSSMDPDSEKNAQGTADVRAEDLRPGSPFMCKTTGFPIKSGDRITRDLKLERACILAGHVMELTSGKPAAGVSLSRYISVEGSRSVDSAELKTDESGRFRTLVPPGSRTSLQWSRSSDRDGYIIDTEWQQQGNYQAMADRVITSDVTDLALKIKLWQVGPLSGKVTDEQGKPVKGALIYLHPDVPAVRADASGAFQLKVGPRDRDFDLCAVNDDRSLAAVQRFKAGTSEVTLTLKPTRDYPGRALTPDGFAADNLKFYMDLSLNGQSLYRVREEPTTDGEGRFTARKLVPGAAYKMFWSSDHVENRDYDYGNAEVDLSTLKEGDPITIRATKYINTLMGKVVNAKGEPVAGATITVGDSAALPQDARMNQKPITTDAKGEFAVQRLAGGRITLRIAAEGYKIGSFGTATDSIDFIAKLRPATDPTRWDITAVDEIGQPLADVPVMLLQRDYGRQSQSPTTTRSVRTDAAGKAAFEFPGADPKQPRLTVLCIDYKDFDLGLFAGNSIEDSSIRFVAKKSTQRIRGRVVDSSGRPIAGAKVRLTNLRTDSGGYISFFQLTPEEAQKLHIIFDGDNDGRFELTRIDGQNWTNFRVSAPGYASVDSYSDPARDKLPKTIPLQKSGSARGRVILKETGRAPTTRPAGWLYVFQGQSIARSQDAITAEDWTVRCDGMMPGEYTMLLSLPPALKNWVCAKPPQVRVKEGEVAEFTIVLEEGIHLRGKLIDAATGQAVAGYVQVRPGGDSINARGVGAQKDGSWEVFVPPGSCEIYYAPPEARTIRRLKTINLEAGKTPEELIMKVDTKTTK